ncbi:2-hydroxyacid dehydrogenase family protein [Staphylococcus simulans]|uniref:2-hydroxyacid dehydrogenase n=1 Tax=Staphylococcus simulans UMC-CNS-990 TaxID=1405498 RepID=A0ABP2YW46_STASI|nr:2-hydroxyacid dehydrogenase family protein [Staphylococcus simulans]ERS94309.1 2-hydroxyacid dehydrogenase [Staphylococcus simulans UMC-CNS-990]MCE5149601.1 2-hydroxyacid dehydrogenase family protein [Staphylococcus simulans]MDU0420899.1 2-hydroxyacid dehydrogenase family protein [Staphylococcus simulans]MDU0467635.1 2-hydroxyacid dehydrogenase family protein [Staphylococcus simulans]PTJ34706.1 hydroxyacid dehydrogenase [Staphylococcus simulans]
MAKVYIAGPIPQVGLDILEKNNIEVDMYDGPGVVDQETLKNGVKDADALISILSTNVDKDVIAAGENLKVIANYGAGFNNVDIECAESKGIYVTNTPGVSTRSTAELTFALVLAVARRIAEGDQLSRTKGFDGWAPLFFRGREVSGKTIGIFGLGNIGYAVAKRAKAFDMDILYTGPHRKEDKEKELGAKYVDFDTLLKESDFITINAAYKPELHHLFDTEQFKQMKPTAYLVNAARGPIVNEQALADALKDKVIEGAALDVYEFEPKITEDLKSLDNVVITPHIGNATFEARDGMAEIVANNTVDVLKDNKAPQYVVNNVK